MHSVAAMKCLLAALLIGAMAACSVAPAPASRPAAAVPKPDSSLADGLYAEIATPRGTILCELYFQKMPLTVASFVGLAEGSLGPEPRKPFFDGLTFHRVVPGFVVQGGDPTGTGNGGPGYRFPDEFAAGLRHDGPGILSMANSGPDTNGSQFFITLGEARYLDYVHSIFGRVIRGQELLAQIERGDRMTVKIIRQGRAARRFQADERTFAQLLARASRFSPPHLADHTGLGAGGENWQAKYLENRLANLARFTGRQIFVRLLGEFEPDSPDQTIEQAVEAMPAALSLPPNAILAVYFASTDQWFLAGARKGLVLPETKPPPPMPPVSPDSALRAKQSQIYKAAGLIVSSLIDQTDPK